MKLLRIFLIMIIIGGLEGTYYFYEAVFHTSNWNGRGGEHTKSGTIYDSLCI